jgi:hypothetical protein
MKLSLREAFEIVCELAEQNVLDERDYCGDESMLEQIPRQQDACSKVRDFAAMYFDDIREPDDSLSVDLLEGMDHYLVEYVVAMEASFFDCHADDGDHAMEQCLAAHPGCQISRVWLFKRVK